MANPASNPAWDQSGNALTHGYTHQRGGADPILPPTIQDEDLDDLRDIVYGLAAYLDIGIDLLRDLGKDRSWQAK